MLKAPTAPLVLLYSRPIEPPLLSSELQHSVFSVPASVTPLADGARLVPFSVNSLRYICSHPSATPSRFKTDLACCSPVNVVRNLSADMKGRSPSEKSPSGSAVSGISTDVGRQCARAHVERTASSHDLICSVWQRRNTPNARTPTTPPAPTLRSSAPAIISSWAGGVENGVHAKVSGGDKAGAKAGKLGVRLDAGVAHGAV